jgi:hypothetical protein
MLQTKYDSRPLHATVAALISRWPAHRRPLTKLQPHPNQATPARPVAVDAGLRRGEDAWSPLRPCGGCGRRHLGREALR